MKSEQSLFTAADESARIFNHAVSEVAHSSRLITSLSQFRSVSDVVSTMDFLPERAAQVGHLLDVLVTTGDVEAQQVGDQRVYRALAQDAPTVGERYRPRTRQIESWYGEGHSELIRNGNKQMLGHDLSFLRSESAAVQFNREYEHAWRVNLENPLYEFGRMAAVRELVGRGTRFLDLASGPGYGAMRLAEFAEGPCTITCVDKSHDFLDMARHNVYPQADIRFIERDLNTGLPPLPAGGFDGVLFNGAFHFMADAPNRLAEIWRALRPGGAFALAHCFSHSGFEDQAMHDFYFSLLADRAYVMPWATIKNLVEETGFSIYREYHRGSHSYLIAERPVAEPDTRIETSLDDLGNKIQLRGGAL